MATDPFPLHHQSEALFAVDAARLFAHLDDHRGLAGHRTGPLLGFGDPCFALAGRTCRLRRARLNNGPQPGRSDGDKPSDRGLGRHVVRRRERVETVDR